MTNQPRLAPIDKDDLDTLYLAVIARQTFESTGVEDTPANRERFRRMEEFRDDLPPGAMLEVPF